MQMQVQRGAQLGQQSCMLRGRKAFTSVIVRVQPGRMDPFSENAAQVKRLINRDRKEFLGNQDDILDKYQSEFGEPSFSTDNAPAAAPAAPKSAPQATPAATATQPANPFSAATPASNPFGAPASSSNPFGAPSSSALPFKTKSAIEPAGLRPDMSPDPFTKEKGFNLFESITLTQVVLFFSFTLIIGLMIGTFYFVLSVGGVRLNGI